MKKNRKHKILPSVLMMALALSLTACHKDQCKCQLSDPCPWCGVENPLEELPWMKKLIEEYCDWPSGSLNVYACSLDDGAPAFMLDLDPRCDDGFKSLVNCQGETIGRRGGIAGETVGTFNLDWGSLRLIYQK